MTEEQIYQVHRANGMVYFGDYLASRQGDPMRHIYMQSLVALVSQNKCGDKIRILEIGSWAGGSAITFANALKQYNNSNGSVVCVDLWRPYFDPNQISGPGHSTPTYLSMYNGANSGEIFNLFLHNIAASGNSDIVFPFRGTSDELLPLLATNCFDIIFIDGDHRYAPTCKDILNCIPILNQDGYLCGDDLEMQLDQLDDQCKLNALSNAHKDFMVDPVTNNSFHPGVTLAVGKLLGPVSCYRGFWLVQKSGDNWLNVELSSEGLRIPEHLCR